MRIAYVRVSSIDQNEQRQIEALKQHDIEKWFIEKVSGKNTDRPKLQEMIDFARDGDIIYIHDFSRLARSTKDLLDLVDTFNQKGITLVSNKEHIDSNTPTGKLMLTMIGAIAEFERTNLLERQREGIEIAKREKRYKGRKAVSIPDFSQHYEMYMKREISKSELSRELHISRPTLDKLIAEYERK